MKTPKLLIYFKKIENSNFQKKNQNLFFKSIFCIFLKK